MTPSAAIERGPKEAIIIPAQQPGESLSRRSRIIELYIGYYILFFIFTGSPHLLLACSLSTAILFIVHFRVAQAVLLDMNPEFPRLQQPGTPLRKSNEYLGALSLSLSPSTAASNYEIFSSLKDLLGEFIQSSPPLPLILGQLEKLIN